MRTISIETQLVDTVVNKLKGLEQDKFMKLDGICLFIVTGNSKCIKQVTDAQYKECERLLGLVRNSFVNVDKEEFNEIKFQILQENWKLLGEIQSNLKVYLKNLYTYSYFDIKWSDKCIEIITEKNGKE